MFDFLLDMGNHDQRKIDNYSANGCVVDTCMVSDGNQPFETGVSHPDYGSGKWIIVESYGSPEDAQSGHNQWVSKMTNEPLPEQLIDCKNAEISTFIDDVLIFPRNKMHAENGTAIAGQEMPEEAIAATP